MIPEKVMAAFGGTGLGKHFEFNLSDAPRKVDEVQSTLNGRRVIMEMGNGDILIAKNKTVSKKETMEIKVLDKETVTELRKIKGSMLDPGKEARLGGGKKIQY
jgi:hypothetical protein